jgi:hypothetical protein
MLAPFETTKELFTDNEWNSSLMYSQPPEKLHNLAYSDSVLCGIGESKKALYCNSGTPDWVTIGNSSKIKQMTMSKGYTCGVNDESSILCTQDILGNDNTGLWRQMNGSLDHVSLSENMICGVKQEDEDPPNLWCAQMTGEDAIPWTKISNKNLRQVSVYNSSLCGVNKNNDVFCTNDVLAPFVDWRNIKGKFSHVDVFDDKVFGLSSNSNAYIYDKMENANWKQLDKASTNSQISSIVGFLANTKKCCKYSLFIADNTQNITLANYED